MRTRCCSLAFVVVLSTLVPAPSSPAGPAPAPRLTELPQIPLPPAFVYAGEQLVFDGRDLRGVGGTVVTLQARRPGGGITEASAVADERGRFTVCLDASELPVGVPVEVTVVIETEDGIWFKVRSSRRVRSRSPANEVVEPNVTPRDPATNVSTESCTTAEGGCAACGGTCSPELFNSTNEPTSHGVQTLDGAVTDRFGLTGFETRGLGFGLNLYHQSMTRYGGPVGRGFSHSYNLHIAQTSPDRAVIATSDLRTFEVARIGEDPEAPGREIWSAPEGFYSRLVRDQALNRWILTHHEGCRFEFLLCKSGCAGQLVAIEDPNGNRTELRLDPSGLLATAATDLGQEVRFGYDGNQRLQTVTDPIGRTTRLAYDPRGRLQSITTPAAETARVEAGEEITDRDLPGVLAVEGRTTRFSYGDRRHPNHITEIIDPRGAVPLAYRYDAAGRVRVKEINGRPVRFVYEPRGAGPLPEPLALLEPGNRVTRVIDREGNVTDHEIHGPLGNPRQGGEGRFGLRRTVEWTGLGARRSALRAGEPPYWERRWLHDCDCLAPRKVSQAFRPDGGADGATAFDEDGMPLGYPTGVFEYNDRRQVTAYLYANESRPEDLVDVVGACRANAADPGRETICWAKTYDRFEGFSRVLSYTEPRGFDGSPVYRGLAFTHTYAYDTRFDPEQGRFVGGNRTLHLAPTVTRGVGAPQTVLERWTYNEHGQVTNHADANGNLTTYTYFEGPRVGGGGDVNTQGEFPGYLAAMTRGAAGSADPVTGLTTTYRVNALGMVTRRTDPRGLVSETEYDDVDEVVRELEPEVMLANGRRVRYETRHVYDAAGNRVLRRRLNLDLDGEALPNEWIDRSQSFDAVGNLLSSRVEVDGADRNDLVTRYRYDGNDQLAVVEQPEGNRTFHLHDERRLRFKTFYGVAPSASGDPAQSYPGDKRQEGLEGTGFVGFTTTRYDARRNADLMRDGRGNLVHHHYDFFNRRVATSDPNGNGMVYVFDDASNVLTEEGGAVLAASGEVSDLLERGYSRYDELGRRFQQAMDIDLGSDESALVDPDDGANSSFRTVFDPGSRVVSRLDANGNPTATTYDAADRTLAVTDALGNVRSFVYDANSNVVRTEELELPGPGADGVPERYVTEHVYDELDRRTETHVRGLDGTAIDHETLFAYDSRHNTRRVIDAEGKATRTTFDDLDRVILTQRFSADPGARGVPPGVTELIHYEYRYDRNSRKAHDIARSDVDDPETAQATLYLYDDLDRLVTNVYPDADDFRQAVDGPGYLEIDPGNPDGADGIYDRVEMAYDENSNAVRTKEQREVVFHNAYDPGDRLTVQAIDLPPDVPGTTRQEFEYDDLNRLTAARNDYSQVSRAYDPLSRLSMERQEIRLDGSGFEAGYERPVDLHFEYDRQSNRTRVLVLGPEGETDLDTRHGYDALNRMTDIDAAYFDRPLHDIADYSFQGPWREHTKRYGNGAVLTRGYDAKRRVRSHVWTDGTEANEILVGFEYDYDDVDNPLFERFLHDEGRYDNYGYNDRYELTGVTYRAPGPVDYRVDPVQFESTFEYDDNFNRRASDAGDPLNQEPNLVASYEADKANEYTSVTILGHEDTFEVAHDRAGNMTKLPTRPVAGGKTGKIAQLEGTWDAFNLMYSAKVPDAEAESLLLEKYYYDPLGRRISKFNLLCDNSASVLSVRRFIWQEWSTITERTTEVLSERDCPLQSPIQIPSDQHERVYVNGRMIDEPLFVAIDWNRNRELSRETRWSGGSPVSRLENFYLTNRMKSVIRVLQVSVEHAAELYRYEVYGRRTVVVLDQSELVGSTIPRPEPHVSATTFTFTGRREDPTGLLNYRLRYNNPLIGQFQSRDPQIKLKLGPSEGNLYQSLANNPTSIADPSGAIPIWLAWCLGVGGASAIYEIVAGDSGSCGVLCGGLCGCLGGSLGAVIKVVGTFKDVAKIAGVTGLGIGCVDGCKKLLCDSNQTGSGLPDEPADPGEGKEEEIRTACCWTCACAKESSDRFNKGDWVYDHETVRIRNRQTLRDFCRGRGFDSGYPDVCSLVQTKAHCEDTIARRRIADEKFKRLPK